MAYLSSLKKPSKPFCKTEQKFLRPAQRYGNFKLIRITCQAACHGKTEHGIFVMFKKPSKTASLPGVKKPSSVMVISNIPESLAKPLVMAKLNMAYLSSLKNRANLFAKPSKNFCARRSVMVILNLSEITCKAACHGKIEHGIFVKFKKPS